MATFSLLNLLIYYALASRSLQFLLPFLELRVSYAACTCIGIACYFVARCVYRVVHQKPEERAGPVNPRGPNQRGESLLCCVV